MLDDERYYGFWLDDGSLYRTALAGQGVAAALGTARKIGLDRLLGPEGNRCRDLVLALVVSRLTKLKERFALDHVGWSGTAA